MNIGRVFNETYKNREGKEVVNRVLDLRTLAGRKKFSISINKNKYDGTKVKEEMEDKPDFHIWYNFSNRGESLPSEIVGSIKNAVSDGGVAYKKGNITDPSFDGGVLWFAMFEVEKEKKLTDNHTHNVSWSPPRSQSQNYSNNSAPATPRAEYYQSNTPTNDTRASDEPPADFYDDEEIPF